MEETEGKTLKGIKDCEEKVKPLMKMTTLSSEMNFSVNGHEGKRCSQRQEEQ